MKYILAPYVQAGFSRNQLKIGYGSIQTIFNDLSQQKILLYFMKFLLQPRKHEEILNYLVINHQLNKDQSTYIVKLFKRKKLIISANELLEFTHNDNRDNLFLSLYTSKPIAARSKLKNKHVTIIGCGGVGATIATILSSKGIRFITLIDNDIIEKSNFNRNLLYQPSDIGKKKIEVIAARLKARYPNCNFELVDEKIISDNQLSFLNKSDFIVVSGDSKNIAKRVNKFCFQNNIPFTIAGYINDIITWGPLFVPSKTACYDCFAINNIDNLEITNQEIISLLKEINNNYVAPAVAELTLTSASLASLDILKYLCGLKKIFSLGKRIGYWTHNGTWHKQYVKQNIHCKICID